MNPDPMSDSGACIEDATGQAACDGSTVSSSATTLTRRSFVTSAMAAGLSAGTGLSAATDMSMAATGGATGPERTKVPYGADIQSDFFDSEPYRQAFLRYCDLIMPGNELKFGLIHPEPGTWRFEPADLLVDFALSHDRLCRGTCHVWWGTTPPWVEALSPGIEAERALVDHIETVMDRYRGKLRSFDVVNEIVAYDPARSGPLRQTTWLEKLGPRHIPTAFSASARADPQCELVLNDYDLEFVGPLYDTRRGVVLSIVRQLQDGNVRIDGVGIQGHLYTERKIDITALDRFHRDLDALGVKLWITELDVIARATPPDPAAQDAAAMAIVSDFLKGVFAFKPPEALITWGMTDRYSWVNDVLPRPDGAPSRPLPLDRDYRPKDWLKLIGRYTGSTRIES